MTRLRRSVERSLTRARIGVTAITVVGLAIVMVVGAFVVERSYRGDLLDQVDARLGRAATTLESAIEVTDSRQQVDFNVQAIDETGTVVFSGTPLVGVEALWQPGEPTEAHSVRSADVGYRIVVTPYRSVWVVLAEPLAPVDEAVRTLRHTVGFAAPAVLAAFGVVVWLAIGRALRPVAAATEREHRFVTDASHELRTPIAAVRVLVETEPDDDAAIADNRRRIVQGLDRLTAITDQLMQLGHVESGSPRTLHPVDLDDVVRRIVERLRGTHDREVDVARVVAGQVHGSEADLESVIENLLTNAVRHARRRVEVGVEEYDGQAVLTVDDDGPGIAVDDRTRVFERFTRLDGSRARASGGAGLGLAIVRETVEAHSGSVRVAESPSGGCRFVVSLPATTVA